MNKLYSVLGLMAITGTMNAQTSMPNAIYTLNFEGIESANALDAEQVGNGLFLKSSNPNFGTYYQNNPDVVTGSHKNYLIVPTQGFINAAKKNNEAFSIGLWINAYVANKSTVSHYYSTVLSAYSQTDSYKTFSWPMFSARERQTLQINCAGWSDFVNEENVNGTNVESTAWNDIKLYDTEDTDEEGNPIKEDHGFEDNWHYVVFTFNGVNAKYYVDCELKNEWNATNNNYCFPAVMSNLNAIYLGDCGPFWQDQDASYAYDDINFYASEITPDQQELIMNIKLGNIGDNEKLAIAQSQLESCIDDAREYNSEIENKGFEKLSLHIVEFIENIGDASDYTSIEEINKKIAELTAERDNIAEVINAYDLMKNIISYNTEFCNNTLYPGNIEFTAALATASAASENPSSIDDIENVYEALHTAQIAYVFSQPIEKGGSIDVTRVIDNPWFCDESIEPTVDEEGVATYPVENPTCERGMWENSFSETLMGACDCTMYYTQGRTTWNNFHSSTEKGTLNVTQYLYGLPAGYYTVSADMISSADATDNHVFATSSDITKISQIFSGNGWDGKGAGIGNWQTLTTDKVLVNKDGGNITIGATATTDGTAYKGWYCVTNFRLTYYGTEVDLAADLADKKADAETAIKELTLKGEIADANALLKNIMDSDDSDYNKLSRLTNLIIKVNENVAIQNASTELADVKKLYNESEGVVKQVYANAVNVMTAIIESENATVIDVLNLNSLYYCYVNYASTVEAASTWGTTQVATELSSQMASLSTENNASILDKTEALVTIMKSSITEFKATENEPKDISFLIASPSFTGDNATGWTVTSNISNGETNSGSWSNWYSECEFYNMSFDIHQTIENLPAGSYRVAVQGFYRDGGRDTAVNNYNTVIDNEDGTQSNAFIANAKLYANSMSSDMMSLGAYKIVGEDNTPSIHADGTNYAWYQPNSDAEPENLESYPDGMNSAQYCFEKGLYADNQVDVVLTEAGDLTLGIRKETTINTDWCIFDNFKLYYLGQDVPTEISSASAATAETSAIYSVAGNKINTLGKGINIVKMSDGTVKKILVK